MKMRGSRVFKPIKTNGLIQVSTMTRSTLGSISWFFLNLILLLNFMAGAGKGDEKCPSVGYSVCSDFAEAFDLLYQVRDEGLYPESNPMLLNANNPVHAPNAAYTAGDVLSKVHFPIEYIFTQSVKGIETFDGYTFASLPDFPGTVQGSRVWNLDTFSGCIDADCGSGSACASCCSEENQCTVSYLGVLLS